MSVRIGVDIGGTFTDVAAVGPDGIVHLGKRLTSAGSEDEAAVGAALDCGVAWGDPRTILAHGTTLVINALLERRTARTALVATRGFADVHELATDARPEPYDLGYRRLPPLVPESMRLEVDERVAADGEVLRRPTEDDLAELVRALEEVAPQAIAIAFLNSYVEPRNEQFVANRLAEAFPGAAVCTSSDISQRPREYQRFTTAAANAAVAPVMRNYLGRLEAGLRAADFDGDLIVLDSNGGAQGLGVAMEFPLRTVESGPVAGALACRNLALAHGVENAVTFDMGGTTAKASLIENGRFLSTDLYWVGGYTRGFPVHVPSIDILEVGAGGGSIAWLEDGSRLRVGPRSAGSNPGPVCYGLGGTEPTVTDANLYCGHLPQAQLSGSLDLDVDAAGKAFTDLAVRVGMDPRRVARGVLHLATLSMAGAVRRQTLERGRDPRDFWLIASGGAGPMHACDVAAEVGIGHVAIPVHPGHYSALGMLSADLRFERVRAVSVGLDELDAVNLQVVLAELQKELSPSLQGVGASEDDTHFQYALYLRYEGQEHTVKIVSPAPGTAVPQDFRELFTVAFADEYRQRFGHADRLSRIEVVQVEVSGQRTLPQPRLQPRAAGAQGASDEVAAWFGLDGPAVQTPVLDRGHLEAGVAFDGPAIVCEQGATSVIPPGARTRVLDDLTMLVALD